MERAPTWALTSGFGILYYTSVSHVVVSDFFSVP